MSPFGFKNERKKNNDDDAVEVDNSSVEEMRSQKSQSKTKIKQSLQQMNHYVNKLKQSKTDTTPVLTIKVPIC